MIQRRRFIRLAAASGLVLGGPLGTSLAQASTTRPLHILILGGTRFLGVHLTAAALARGHTVTFFNRGRTHTERFPQVERLLGDRDGERLGGLSALDGRAFDAVIDTSGYVPRHVRLSAELLSKQTPHYLFISTISVYEGFTRANDEDSPLGTLEDSSVETVDGQTYGPLKALCEDAARQAYADQTCTILRPGLIVGPYDNTDRFTYWPARAARGGRFIAPGEPRDPIQIIDARDLARYSIACLETRISGTFNVVNAPGTLTIGDLVSGSMAAAQQLVAPTPRPEPIWMPAKFLTEQQVSPWGDMPAWVPDTSENYGFARTSVERALRTGLGIRPLEETLTDTLQWHLERPAAARDTLRAGLSATREAEVLALWDRL